MSTVSRKTGRFDRDLEPESRSVIRSIALAPSQMEFLQQRAEESGVSVNGLLEELLGSAGVGYPVPPHPKPGRPRRNGSCEEGVQEAA